MKITKNTHVMLLKGGFGSERDVSLRSAKACAEAIKENDLRVTEVDIGLNGINELTVSCIKTNDGNTSSVIVFIYSKNNFDAIVFSNKIEDGLIKNSKNLGLIFHHLLPWCYYYSLLLMKCY